MRMKNTIRASADTIRLSAGFLIVSADTIRIFLKRYFLPTNEYEKGEEKRMIFMD